MRFPAFRACTGILASLFALPARADGPVGKDAGFNDIPKAFTQTTAPKDYVRRVEMIPMRGGVKLFTVIWIPSGAHDAPIVLTRTPYNADKHARDVHSASLINALPLESEGFVRAGYIRVYQDVRGKYGSQGDYVMTRPPVGPLNPTKV